MDIGPFAFLGLALFLWVAGRSRPRRAALAGYVFGFAYFAATLSWLWIFGWLAWIPLVALESVFVAAFGLLAVLLWRPGRPVVTALSVAAAWVGTEYLRSLFPLGGVTWAGLGSTQHANPMLLPLASVTGEWGLSFVVVLGGAALVLAISRGRAGEGRGAVRVLAVAAVAALAPRLIPLPHPSGPPVEVAVVQGEGPAAQRAGLSPSQEDVAVARGEATLHEGLQADPPDLAVWPENALDADPRHDPLLGSIAERAIASVGVPTIVGAITDGPNGTFRNSNLLYDGSGRIVARYDKLHLVPFGEYVPWRRYLGFITTLRQVPQDLSPGHGHVLFHAAGSSFATVSFAFTALSRQHVVMSQMRAVENGRYVVHAAISGISAFIDPRGRVLSRTELFRPTLLRASVPQIDGQTLYTRWGEWLPWVSLGAVGLALLFGTAPAGGARRRRAPRMEPRRALVVLPTYNERATVRDVVTRVLAADPRTSALVVDDGSPDGTANVVRELAAGEPRVSLLERPRKAGLASAYLTGFRKALQDGYDVVVEMDADLSHEPGELGRLLQAMRDHDLVIGSRYVPGGAVTNWGLFRRTLSRGGNAYVRAVLGLPLSDATSGYRAYRHDLLEALVRWGITSEGYAFQVELAYRAWRGGYAVGEVPITFREREHGHSKISRAIVLEAMWKVAGWAVRDRFRRHRRGATVERPDRGQM